MRFAVGVLITVGAGALSLAVADPTDNPPASTATPAAQAPAAAPESAAQTPAPAQSAAAPSKSEDSRALEREKHFLAEGYRIEMRHGEKVFCRREDTMGTRLGAQKVCSTAEQLTDTERQAQASVNRSSMQQNNPAGR